MEGADIRWRQRLDSFSKALAVLEKFWIKGAALNELEEMGLIQAFEITYELAWNTIKDFYVAQGETGLQGSRDAISLAFRRELITDGELWMQMLKDRNRTTHTYNEETAAEIGRHILEQYYSAFVELKKTFESIP